MCPLLLFRRMCMPPCFCSGLFVFVRGMSVFRVFLFIKHVCVPLQPTLAGTFYVFKETNVGKSTWAK